MAQWIKAPADELGNFSLIPGSTWSKERADPLTLSSDLHVCVIVHYVLPPMHTHTHTKYVGEKRFKFEHKSRAILGLFQPVIILCPYTIL